MNKEEELLTDMVRKLIHNGVIDELVAAALESSLQTNFDELEALSKRRYLEAHHWQDYADCLTFSRACIQVLRYFTVNDYLTESKTLKEYSVKLEAF
jgi:hypothetical protein